jgi:endo-1,3-1,4-beta-glycanase ExoK
MGKLTGGRESTAPGIIATIVASGLVLAIFSEATSARRPAPLPTAQPSFSDPMDSYVTARWIKADRWTNGSPFDNAWRADHITHTGGAMTITLDNKAYLGEPYSSGEYRTKGFYGYGCYEARFRPIKRDGVVTSFFTFAGPYDNGGNGKHNEIDIEFLGRDTTVVQLNYWTNDDTYSQDHSTLINVPLASGDAALEFANYGFKWSDDGIEWFINGTSVYSASGAGLQPTPKAAESLHKVMMNVWPVDSTASGWAGVFAYPGSPLQAKYEWVRYDANPGCTFSFGADPVT